MKQVIQTDKAPLPNGCYSQAIKINNIVYLSGQLPMDPATLLLVKGDIKAQMMQVFDNLRTVAKAAGGDLSAIVRLNVYLLDLSHMGTLNELMAQYFVSPYPARTTIGVLALPKDAKVEIDAIMILPSI